MMINGDCLEVMKTYPDNHFNGIVTDPPYGLSFMNKEWDHGIPSIEYWKEARRVCKPGSHLLAFGGTRTFHRLTCLIEDSGWEIRDCISWLYGQGFPKSHNHFGLSGYGTALKPAWEPIIMAMKPSDGTFAQNAEKWGQAGINVDACRIPTLDDRSRPHNEVHHAFQCGFKPTVTESHPEGRWPANLILDEEAADSVDRQSSINASRFFYVAKASSSERNRGCEALPQVECQTGCVGDMPVDDNGRERDRFKKNANNFHPTVKPLKLMEYLIRLIAPPKNAIILDPFAGSGTTLLACKNLNIQCIGIEKNAEYCEIAKARLTA